MHNRNKNGESSIFIKVEGGDDSIIANNCYSPKKSSAIQSNLLVAKQQRLSKKRILCYVLLVFVLYAAGTVFSNLILRKSVDACDVALKYAASLHKDQNVLDGVYQKKSLPKIIHHQWKTLDVPDKYKEWYTKWKDIFPESEYTYKFWSDETALELIKTHYNWFLPVYSNYKFNIQRADAARYFILHHYGGIYADLDYEPLENFWGLIPNDRVGLIESPYQYNEYVQNSFMSSPKDDPFWLTVFKALSQEKEKAVLKSTGPVLLDTAISMLEKKYPDGEISYSILPCELYHRIPIGETDKSPFLTLLHREILGRFFPMKQCGNYNDLTCQYGRHHNTASYINDTGLLGLI